jgi:hypothetical protein
MPPLHKLSGVELAKRALSEADQLVAVLGTERRALSAWWRRIENGEPALPVAGISVVRSGALAQAMKPLGRDARTLMELEQRFADDEACRQYLFGRCARAHRLRAHQDQPAPRTPAVALEGSAPSHHARRGHRGQPHAEAGDGTLRLARRWLGMDRPPNNVGTWQAERADAYAAPWNRSSPSCGLPASQSHRKGIDRRECSHRASMRNGRPPRRDA